MKIEKIEIHAKATVILTNDKGERFEQEVNLNGQFIVPPNFKKSTMFVKEGEGSEQKFFTKKLGM